MFIISVFLSMFKGFKNINFYIRAIWNLNSKTTVPIFLYFLREPPGTKHGSNMTIGIYCFHILENLSLRTKRKQKTKRLFLNDRFGKRTFFENGRFSSFR